MKFAPGHKKIEGSGRAPGQQNKSTLKIKEAFRNLIEQATPQMVAWLAQVAAEDPAKALSLVTDMAEFVLPKLARVESKMEHDGNITISWEVMDYGKTIADAGDEQKTLIGNPGSDGGE